MHESYGNKRAKQKQVCHAIDVVCRLLNLLTQMEMQKALEPLVSLGGHFYMEDHKQTHKHTHSHYPPPTPSTGFCDSAKQEWKGGEG